MDFYEKKRRAGLDLATWINTDERDSFEAFGRRMLAAYGFDKTNMLKMLNKNYKLTISDDGELVRLE